MFFCFAMFLPIDFGVLEKVVSILLENGAEIEARSVTLGGVPRRRNHGAAKKHIMFTT